MSGICDTCRCEHCHTVVDNITSCDFYVGGKTRWHDLFGTPERAARTLENGSPLCDWCDTNACEKRGGECSLFDYDALLEWLNGDSE